MSSHSPIRHFTAEVQKSKAPGKTPGEDGTLMRARLTTQARISNHLFDDEGNPVDEMFLSRGASVYRKNNSCPMYYGHEYHNLENACGSFVNLRQDRRFYVGDLKFSSVRQDAKTLVEEEHIDSVSVGVFVNKARFVEAGESKLYFEGDDDETFVEGPCVVYEKWDSAEVSLRGCQRIRTLGSGSRIPKMEGQVQDPGQEIEEN